MTKINNVKKKGFLLNMCLMSPERGALFLSLYLKLTSIEMDNLVIY